MLNKYPRNIFWTFKKDIVLEIVFLLAICFLLSGCTKPLDIMPDARSQKPEYIRHLASKPWPRPKTVKIGGIECKQVQYPLGKYGGTLNLSTFGSGPKTFNLWASTDNTSSTLARLMFDGLFETDPDTGDVVPHLAKSYQILDGGKTIIVKLREGITWSDGEPITSDDVVFTWNNIVFSGLEGGGFQSLCLVDGKYPTVKKIDYKTIEFMTHVVFAPFLRQIDYPPAPKHIIEPLLRSKKNSEEAKKFFLGFWGADTDPKKFVTSGPFKLSRYVQGERIEFVKNPNYFVINTENQKLPYLNKIVYTIVQDSSLELFKFLAGEIDVVSVRGEDVALVKKLEKKKNFKTVNLGPSSGTEFLVFNLRRDIPNRTSTEWFNNGYFRQALSHAVDRVGIVDNVLAGVGKPLFTPESLPSIYLNKKISDGYPQNLELARKLLKQGGFKWNANSELIDDKDRKIEFTVLTNAENNVRQAIGVIIQDDLKKLGIKVNLRPLDFNTLIGRSDSGDWEGIIIGFTGGFFEPNDGANVWKLGGRLHMFDESLHKGRDWEIEIDKIFNEATKHLDFKVRKKLYDRFQEIVYKQLPFVYLVSPLRIVATQNELGNVRPTIYGGVLYNLESIYKQK